MTGPNWIIGVRHKLIGSGTIPSKEGFAYHSDESDPLTFMVSKKGYVYRSGSGFLDTNSGNTFVFGDGIEQWLDVQKRKTDATKAAQ